MTSFTHATRAHPPRDAGVSHAAVRGADRHDRATLTRLTLMSLCMLAMLIGGVQQAGAKAAPDGFADLAERLSPAVVNISTSHTVVRPERPRGPMLPENSPFRDLFPELFGDRTAASPARSIRWAPAS